MAVVVERVLVDVRIRRLLDDDPIAAVLFLIVVEIVLGDTDAVRGRERDRPRVGEVSRGLWAMDTPAEVQL